jgi:hypothetical protein
VIGYFSPFSDIDNMAVAIGYKSSKQSVVAPMAIWLLTLFFESSLIQLLQAKRANKMLWMKLSEHSRDATT